MRGLLSISVSRNSSLSGPHSRGRTDVPTDRSDELHMRFLHAVQETHIQFARYNIAAIRAAAPLSSLPPFRRVCLSICGG